MGQPVVHFEIIGNDPESYGFLDLMTSESLGGIRVMDPATSPNGLVVGHFRDPEGTLIGVAGVA